jgi:hypothetical protein
MKFLPKFYTSIPLVILGGLLINLFIPGDDDCRGIAEAMEFFGLSGAYLLYFLIIISISIYKYYKKDQKVNSVPLIVTALLIVISFFLPEANGSSFFNSPTKLYAYRKACIKFFCFSNLELKENGKFVVYESGEDFSCTHRGTYVLKGDTVIIQRDLFKATDSAFSNKYFIDTQKGKLYPINGAQITTDTTKWLTIGKGSEYFIKHFSAYYKYFVYICFVFFDKVYLAIDQKSGQNAFFAQLFFCILLFFSVLQTR